MKLTNAAIHRLVNIYWCNSTSDPEDIRILTELLQDIDLQVSARSELELTDDFRTRAAGEDAAAVSVAVAGSTATTSTTEGTDE